MPLSVVFHRARDDTVELGFGKRKESEHLKMPSSSLAGISCGFPGNVFGSCLLRQWDTYSMKEICFSGLYKLWVSRESENAFLNNKFSDKRRQRLISLQYICNLQQKSSPPTHQILIFLMLEILLLYTLWREVWRDHCVSTAGKYHIMENEQRNMF